MPPKAKQVLPLALVLAATTDSAGSEEGQVEGSQKSINLVCIICRQSSKDGAQFMVIAGKTSDGCLLCIAVARRMAPGLSLQEISEKVKSEKEFGAEWTRAKKALQEELDLSKDSALPTFLPSGSCARTVRYGHVVYDKAALLSSDQLVALVGKTARQLNLTPWTGDSSKPGSSTEWFPVSLIGLPRDFRDTCRKVKFFYETNTDMQENFLTPDTQLARFERQAPYVFAYVHGRYWAENSGRYEGVGPGLKRQQQALPTLTSLKESADRIEASLKAAATQAAPEVMMDALENEDETPEQAAQKEQAQRIIQGLSDLHRDGDRPMKRQKKKAEKDKDKESTKAPSTPTAAMSSTAAPSTPATPVPCETGSVTSGGKSKGNEGDMDEVMRGVALLYSELAKSQRGRVAQSRSLASLRVEIFMSSDSSGHQLNNTLTGAAKIRDYIAGSRPDSGELQNLNTRYEQCAALYQWQTVELKTISTEELDIMVKKVKQYWDVLPGGLKAKFTAAKAYHLMTSVTAIRFESEDDAAKAEELIDEMVSMVLAQASPPTSWVGLAPRNSDLLQEALAVLNDAVGRAESVMEETDAVKADKDLEEVTKTFSQTVQAISMGCIECFKADGFLKLWREPEEGIDHFLALGEPFVKGLNSSRTYVESLMHQGEPFSSLSGLIESIDFITQLFKALDFTWGLGLKGFGSDPTIHDVLRFTSDAEKKRSGQTLVETTLKDSAMQSQQWLAASDEILRTAATSVKLRPTLERVADSLQKFRAEGVGGVGPSADRLIQLVEEFSECSQGMRRYELLPVESLLLTVLRAMADGFISMGKDDACTVSSKEVRAVLKGLHLFKHRASEHQLAAELEKWLLDMSAEMAVSDLVELAIHAMTNETVDFDQLTSVMTKCQKLQAPKGKEDFSFHMAGLLLTAHKACLTEVRQSTSQISQQLIQRRLNLLQKVAEFGFLPEDPLRKACRFHCDIIKPGVAMGNSIFQMMALGRDAEARVAKDEKAIILRTILRNSDEVLNSKADLETFAAPLIGSAKTEGLDVGNDGPQSQQQSQLEVEASAATAAGAAPTAEPKLAAEPSQELAEPDANPRGEGEGVAEAATATADCGPGHGHGPDPQLQAEEAAAAEDDVFDDFASSMQLTVYKGMDAEQQEDEQMQDAVWLQPSPAQSLSLEEKTNLIISDFLQLDSSSAFLDMAQQESMQDFLLRHLVVNKSRMEDASLNLQKGLGSHAKPDWRVAGSFGSQDATVDEVLTTAKATIMKVPVKGQNLLGLIDKLSEAVSAASTMADLVGSASIIDLSLMGGVKEDVMTFKGAVVETSEILRNARALYQALVLVLALKLSKGDQNSVESAKKLVRDQNASMRRGLDGLKDEDIPVSLRTPSEKFLS